MTLEQGQEDAEMAEEGGGRRRRRTFTAEYKADVVAMCRSGERSLRAVALDLGLPPKTVHRWVTEAENGGASKRDGLTSSERDELAQLRKEVRVLREERDILKRATAFFARETR
jgi:transposase